MDQLPNKIDEFVLTIDELDPDIVLVNEVIPKAQEHPIPPCKLLVPGYATFLNFDPNLPNLGGSGIRGTAVYVRKTMPVCQVEIDCDYKELVLVKLGLSSGKNLVTGAVYRSPSSTPQSSSKLCEAIREIHASNPGVICLGGDFNFPGIDWDNWHADVGRHRNGQTAESEFINTLQDCFLLQEQLEISRQVPNQRPAVLDLVLVDKENVVQNITTQPGIGRSDHYSVTFDLVCEVSQSQNVSEARPNFSRGNYPAIRQFISEAALPTRMKGQSAEGASNTLLSVVQEAVRRFVPLSRAGCRPKNKTSRHANRLRKQKYHAWKRWNESQSLLDHHEYRRASNNLRRETRNAAKQKEEIIAKRAKSHPKEFWRFINSRRKTKQSINSLKRQDGTVTTDSTEMAELLNKQFASVFTNEDLTTLPTMSPHRSPGTTLETITITPEAVADKLKKLDVNKTPGLDGIHPRLLRECVEVLAGPLAILLQMSIDSGEVPSLWKKANVTSIHKKGSKLSAGNYRPISLTSVICKLLEHFIREAIIAHLMSNDLLCDEQHGFVPGRSCATQLLSTLEDWTTMLENGMPFDAAYMDFSKAFDSVAHTRLAIKLDAYGIRGDILQWIKEFLSGRLQRTMVNNATSTWVPVTSGIPQGSVLGPTLFVVFINDLPLACESECKIFADDTKLYRTVKEPDDIITLEADIDALQKWSNKWQLPFNADKCKVMHFGSSNPNHKYKMGDTPLLEVTEEKDLGVLVDNKLRFRKQVSAAVAKGNQMLGMIKRSFTSRDASTFCLLYRSIVRPHLEYVTTAWNPRFPSDRQKLERVQERATKLVKGLEGLTYPERLHRLNLPSLSYRRLRGSLIQAYKIFSGIDRVDKWKFFIEPPIRSRTNRGHALKIFPTSNKSLARKGFFSQLVIKAWNTLPVEVVESSTINAFKVGVDAFYGNQKSAKYDF